MHLVPSPQKLADGAQTPSMHRYVAAQSLLALQLPARGGPPSTGASMTAESASEAPTSIEVPRATSLEASTFMLSTAPASKAASGGLTGSFEQLDQNARPAKTKTAADALRFMRDIVA